MPPVNKHPFSLQYYQSFDGYQMAYTNEGDGTPILLLHGVPTSSYLFRKMIPLLVNKGYRVIAVDLLGYGQSEKPSGYDV
jgi:haloalkane dehalogenase